MFVSGVEGDNQLRSVNDVIFFTDEKVCTIKTDSILEAFNLKIEIH